MSRINVALVEKAAQVLSDWGVRSRHGEWSDQEAQGDAARAVLAAVLPDVRRQVAEEIAAAIDELPTAPTCTPDHGCKVRRAARVAREVGGKP